MNSHSRIDKALQSAILESYIKEVSTRNVQDIINTLDESEISAASVSRVAKTLDEAVETFLKRPIEKPTPYLFIDATYCKIREDSCYVTKALFIAVGVNEDGYREILGTKLANRRFLKTLIFHTHSL